jgi:cyclopropane-fatty-acyl-phospholipid synthase
MSPKKLGYFDRIYSIGMLEHVRCKNYISFFQRVKSILNYGGRFVLHTITTNRSDTTCNSGSTQIFLTKYIFPGGQIPKIEWVLDAARYVGLQLVHLETYGGHHYAKTLHTWRDSMLNSKTKLYSEGYNDELIKAYEYYMTECEAAFMTNTMQLTHFVFDNILHNYEIKSDVFTC